LRPAWVQVSEKNKLDVIMHICNPTYTGSIGMIIV
jgi:hypothetical protein